MRYISIGPRMAALLTAAFFNFGCSGPSTVVTDLIEADEGPGDGVNSELPGADLATMDTKEWTDSEIMGGACDEAPPAGIARVRPACFEWDPALPYAAEDTGDLVLENAKARFVVRARSDQGLMLLGTGAGSLIDAIPSIDGRYERSLDRLQEFMAFPGFKTLQNPVFSHGMGAPGEAAYIRIEGELAPVPIADTVLPGLGVKGSATLTWRLYPDEPVVHLEVEISPNEVNKVTPVAWMGMLFSGWLDGWTDGQGISGEPGGTGMVYAGVSPEVSLGVYAESGLSFVGASGLVLAMAGTENDGPKNTGVAHFKIAVVPGDLAQLRSAFSFGNTTTRAINIEGEKSFDDVQLLLELLNDNNRVDSRTAVDIGDVNLVEIPDSAVKARLRWADGPAGDTIDLPEGENFTLSPPPLAVIELEARHIGEEPRIPARVILEHESGPQHLAAVGVSGKARVLLQPGTYTATFTRGHEYEAFVKESIVAEPGETVVVKAELERVVDSSGWIACDFHLHSDFSTDSSDPLRRRILEVAAEGVEYAVSTDHDFVIDYKPLRDAQGLTPFLQVTSGVEMSHPKLTHASSWPWDEQRDQSGHGAPGWYKLPPEELFPVLGMDDPTRVFQINHPRGSSGYHNRIKYNPETGEAEQSPNKLGFPIGSKLAGFKYDAMEIYNGKRTEDIDEVLVDWLSLLSQGLHIAGTGTSDSHSSGGYPGSARTYVWVGEGADDPETISEEQIRNGILNGQTLVVGGPFVEAWLLGPEESDGLVPPTGVGQTQVVESTLARLRVRVQAPTWMPTDEIQIYRNQELVLTESLGAPNAETAVIRLDQVYELDLNKDSFFLVLVKAASVPYPYLREQIISFAGPLFLDMDGDGIYTPPGLQAP